MQCFRGATITFFFLIDLIILNINQLIIYGFKYNIINKKAHHSFSEPFFCPINIQKHTFTLIFFFSFILINDIEALHTLRFKG